MSALPPRADILNLRIYVRFVPLADMMFPPWAPGKAVTRDGPGSTPAAHATSSVPPAVMVTAMAIVAARMHVDRDSGLLDETGRLHGTGQAGGQRRSTNDFRHHHKADTGGDSDTHDSLECAASINCCHRFAPR